MNNGIDNLALQLNKTISDKDRKKKTGYDAQATVVKVTDNTIWVNIPGGVDETPVARTVSAKEGDVVQVRVAGGRAWIVGNYTSPATDDTKAIEADGHAAVAEASAFNAQKSADIAKESADVAYVRALEAEQYADSAMASAITANIASNSALTQLSVVEDVASVLTWISEHGTYKLSDDTAVVSGKLYFTRSGEEGSYEYTLVTEPIGNPHTNSYYELDTLGDETVSNYISSHLSLTNAGLWVVKDGNGYKILLANDGMYVYDNIGNLVSTFGQNIIFSANREQHIGNQNAYIIFDPDDGGSITIGGSNVNLGNNKTLDQVISELNNTFILDATYTISGTDPNRVAHLEAHLYQGGVDIKSRYEASQFTWALKTEDGEQPIGNPNTGYTKDVNISSCGFGAEVVLHFTPPVDSDALTIDNDNLTTNDGYPISVRASGDSVRVRDLVTTTTIYPSEKLLIVGSSDEHLVTVDSLADQLWSMYDVTIEEQPLLKGNNSYENIGLLSITNLEMDAIFTL